MAVLDENGLSHLWGKIKEALANVEIAVDDAFSTTSTNPVQNKIVTNAVTITSFLNNYDIGTGEVRGVQGNSTVVNAIAGHENILMQFGNCIKDCSNGITSIEQNYVKKTDMANVYKYKGSVANASSLPTDASVGDVYDIQSASVYGSAGANVAWTGTAWDSLGEIFSVDSITNTQIDEICV